MPKNKNITPAQARRLEIITREVGCICCRMEHAQYVPAQANHLLNGYRIGHDATVPECPWHHMGECFTGIDQRQMKKKFGPSRKLHKKQFRNHYGSDAVLLALTNDYVRKFEQSTIGGGSKCK